MTRGKRLPLILAATLLLPLALHAGDDDAYEKLLKPVFIKSCVQCHSATHQYNDLPIVVAGTGGGRFKSGAHLHCPDRTPLANLWLTQAQAMGLKRTQFADSTGPLDGLRTG